MPTYDSTKKEILVIDNQGDLHRYFKGCPCLQSSPTDAELFGLTGTLEWKSEKLQDDMELDKLPASIVVAEAIGSYRLRFDWFLDESL